MWRGTQIRPGVGLLMCCNLKCCYLQLFATCISQFCPMNPYCVDSNGCLFKFSVRSETRTVCVCANLKEKVKKEKGCGLEQITRYTIHSFFLPEWVHKQ